MSIRFDRLAAVAALAFAATAALAHDYVIGNLRIDHPAARPTPPGARTASAYFTIQNTGKAADRLIRIASPAAASIELHSMTMDGNLMKMRAVAGIDIPAGGKVTLASGGYHVMLVDLARPLAIGDKVPLTLTFEKAGSIDVSIWVEAPGVARAPTDAMHAH